MDEKQDSKAMDVRLRAMRLGASYRWTVILKTVYGKTIDVTLRPLTCAETLSVGERVREFMEKLDPRQTFGVSEANLVAKETLKIASSPEPGSEAETLFDLQLDNLTPDEFKALYKSYVKIVNEINPTLEELPQAEVDKIIDHLKKNDSLDLRAMITDLSIMELVNVCHALISRG